MMRYAISAANVAMALMLGSGYGHICSNNDGGATNARVYP